MTDSIFYISLILAAVNIPVIVVFTKYDLLVTEHFRASSHITSQPDRIAQAKQLAGKAFTEVTKDLRPICARLNEKRISRYVDSVSKKFGSFDIAATAEKMLLELTQVTRDHLRDVEGSLWALWASAQQINASQKVELSIRCALYKMNMH
jgi:hypothetical protein